MNKRFYIFLLVSLVLAPKVSAAAATQRQIAAMVSLGVPVYSGAGCPTGTVSSALSQNGAALSLLFDSFVVEAGAGIPVARKNCDVEIPVRVPSGIRASLIGVDYRGFNNLPAGAKANLLAEYVFTGAASMLFNTTFYGPLLENYFLQNTLSSAKQVWSSCGGDYVLRSNKALVVVTNNAGEQAMSSVDSIDVVTNDPNRPLNATFYFEWQPCPQSQSPNQTAQPSSGSSLHPKSMGLPGLTAIVLLLTLL